MRKGFVVAAAVVFALFLVAALHFSSRGTDPSLSAPASASGPVASREPAKGAGTVLQPERAEDMGVRGGAEAGSTPLLAEPPTEADGVLEVEVLSAGKPVSGARVRLYWRGARDSRTDEISWRLASTSTTDGTGHARLPSRPGAYLVAVRAQGLAPQRRDVVRPYGEALTHVRLTLEAGQSLTGRTVVRGTEPLPLVELVLTAQAQGLPSWQRGAEAPAEERVYATSDARGTFRIDGLAPGSYQLEASAPGHAKLVRRGVPVPAPRPLVVELTRAGTLEGFVLDAEGRPAAGAEVQVSGRVPQTVTTGEGGGFSVEVEAGAHGVSARRGAEAGSVDKPVLVAVGQTVRDLRVRLGAGAGLEGRVVARAGGAPVAGASVEVSPANVEGDSGLAKTDALGAFTVGGLAPGSYDVVVNAPGFSQTVRRGLTVSAGERFPVEIQLAGTGAVAGVVRDAAGGPVEGVLVRGGNRWGGGLGATPAEARTDAQGHYLLGGLTPGRTQISAKREGVALSVNQQVDVAEGTTVQVDFTLEETGTVEGVVRAASGPLPDAPLAVSATPKGRMRMGPSDWALVDVDAAGHFQMTLPPGGYELSARRKDRGLAGFMRDGVSVTVEAGQTAHAELTLSEPKNEEGTLLSGRVLEADGSTSARAMVQITTEGPTRGTIMSPADDEGHFEYTLAPQMASGTLTVTAHNGGRGGTLRGVKPGAGELLVRLEPSASVRGRVVRPDGQPVKGFHITVGPASSAYWPGASGTWEFAADRFELKDVPGERVRLTVQSLEGAGGETEVTLAPGASAEVDVTLKALAAVRGRVVDATQAPIAEAVIFVEGAARMGGSDETGADGRFVREGLMPGERTVRVMASNRRSAERKVTLVEGQVVDVGDIPLGPAAPPGGSTGR